MILLRERDRLKTTGRPQYCFESNESNQVLERHIGFMLHVYDVSVSIDVCKCVSIVNNNQLRVKLVDSVSQGSRPN